MTYGPGVLDRWASGAVRDREVLKPLWAVCDGGRSGKRPDLETILGRIAKRAIARAGKR